MNKRREFWERNVRAIVGMLIFSVGINLFIVPADLYNGACWNQSAYPDRVGTVSALVFGHYGYCRRDQPGVKHSIICIGIYLYREAVFLPDTGMRVQPDAVFEFDPYPVHAPDPGCTGGQYNRWDFCGSRHRYITAVRRFQRRHGYCGNVSDQAVQGNQRGKSIPGSEYGYIWDMCSAFWCADLCVQPYLFGGKHVDDGPDSHPEYQFRSCYFTKKEPTEIIDYIVQKFHRDATWWEARGGYTEERTYMVIVILSKYECAHLRREIKMVDEHAFVVVKDNMSIHGKYEKHLM